MSTTQKHGGPTIEERHAAVQQQAHDAMVENAMLAERNNHQGRASQAFALGRKLSGRVRASEWSLRRGGRPISEARLKWQGDLALAAVAFLLLVGSLLFS